MLFMRMAIAPDVDAEIHVSARRLDQITAKHVERMIAYLQLAKGAFPPLVEIDLT